MDQPDLNPLIILFFYFIRCLLPLGLLIGFSYILRKLGLIKTPPSPPNDWDKNKIQNASSNGDFSHG